MYDRKFIKDMLKKYLHRKQYDESRSGFNQFVETIFRRKINIKGIADKNFAVRGFAERQAINAPIQGSAADIIKLAMIEIHKEIKLKNIDAEMLLQVHDELIFEVEDKKYDNLINNVKMIMESVHLKYKNFTVPLTVDYGSGDNWGEAH